MKKTVFKYGIELDQIVINKSKSIPFPQADKFNKIIELIYYINDNQISINDVAKYFSFSFRQSQYYLSAMKYLGVLEPNKVIKLSQFGKKLVILNEMEFNQKMVISILSNKVFLEIYKELKKHEIYNREFIINIMKEQKEFKKYKLEVIKRRANTVIGWLKWIDNSSISIY